MRSAPREPVPIPGPHRDTELALNSVVEDMKGEDKQRGEERRPVSQHWTRPAMGLAAVQPFHKQHQLSVLGAEHAAAGRPGVSVGTLIIREQTKQTACQVRVSAEANRAGLEDRVFWGATLNRNVREENPPME